LKIYLIKYITLFLFYVISSGCFSQSADNIQNPDTSGVKLSLKTLTAGDSLSSASDNRSAQFNKDKYKINYLKVGAITGVTGGAFYWLHQYQKNAWWSGQRGKFHFQNDWNYSMSADKTGHFFDGALIQAIYKGAFEWAGFSPTASVWLGAAFSIAYMTDVEIEDGFATDWGFSPGDQIMNVAGALYPVAQYYWKPLRSFNVKWSYFPSDNLTSGAKNGAFLDDYDGQTTWLSINIHDFMPKKAQAFWPDYLNIAAGYGVNDYQNYEKRFADFYVGLDVNWERIIPGNSKFMLWFKNVINHFRFLPMPVLRFNKDGVTYSVNF
jgi:hypothetical protein